MRLGSCAVPEANIRFSPRARHKLGINPVGTSSGNTVAMCI